MTTIFYFDAVVDQRVCQIDDDVLHVQVPLEAQPMSAIRVESVRRNAETRMLLFKQSQRNNNS